MVAVLAMQFASAKVNRLLHDGGIVELKGANLVAHKTAGHTKGCTTWTMVIRLNGKAVQAVIIGSPYVNEGSRLVDNSSYQQITADFERQFQTLKSRPCDIFPGGHGSCYSVLAKYSRLQVGDPNAFVDPTGYQAFVAERPGFSCRTPRAKEGESADLTNQI